MTVSLPDDGADLDGALAAESVGEKARHESAQPGAAGHGGRDPSLDILRGATAQSIHIAAPLVEGTKIRLGRDDG